jgi:tetratricopeptide (TPR) repeat protein
MPTTPKYRTVLFLAALCGVNLFVFAQTAGFDFVNLDDPQYIIDNYRVQRGLSLGSIAAEFRGTNIAMYHPLTVLSHMLDIELFGLNPAGHHLSNLLLHMLGSCLLFLGLAALTNAPGRAAFVAGLFAVHPLHVESVAWISERKDVLSGFFFAAMLWAYSTAIRSGTNRAKAAMFALFTLGLLSKPMLVTVPFVLVLLDFWPLERIRDRASLRSSVTEKIPLFILAALASGVAVWAQSSGNAIRSFAGFDPISRIVNALNGYGFYLLKTFWPSGLSAYYPYPETPPYAAAALSAAAIAAVSFAAYRERVRRPYLLVGWLWFLGMLVPVIGLVQVGSQAYADRYSYLPSIGLFLMAAWGVPSLFPENRNAAKGLAAAAAAVVIAAAAGARAQTRHWKDGPTLFQRAFKVTRGHFSTRMMLADALVQEKRFSEAEAVVRECLALQPRYRWGYYVLAEALVGQGRFREALEPARIAETSIRGYAYAPAVRCRALNGVGRWTEAIASCERALAVDPEHAPAHAAWAEALVGLGRRAEAREHLEAAVRLRPFSDDYRRRLSGVATKSPEPRPRKTPAP